MRIHVLQHSKNTPPGSVAEWAGIHDHSLEVIQVFDNEPLPNPSEVEFLIILGGPMNVDDIEEHPWLVPEKDFIRKVLAREKTCLGICLGGQLLAQVLGGNVRKHEHWEVGWHAIHMGSHQRITVFQWHQDTFDLPANAVRVATNKITENQAFAYGNRVVGLQFHPEATEDWVRERVSSPDYPEGPHVQKAEHVLEDLVLVAPMKKWFFGLLDRLADITNQNLKHP